MAIPLGQLREALFQARKLSPAVTKATKQTMRVLYNEGNFGSLTSLLKGKPDFSVRATLDDMMFPSSKTAAGYADDGYSAASMAKLPKGTVTNRAGSGGGLARIQSDLEFLRRNPTATSRPAPGDMRARVMGLARSQELGALARSGRPAPSYRGLSDKNKSDIKGVVKAVKTKDAATKSAAIAKRRAILKNMKNRK